MKKIVEAELCCPKCGTVQPFRFTLDGDSNTIKTFEDAVREIERALWKCRAEAKR